MNKIVFVHLINDNGQKLFNKVDKEFIKPIRSRVKEDDLGLG